MMGRRRATCGLSFLIVWVLSLAVGLSFAAVSGRASLPRAAVPYAYDAAVQLSSAMPSSVDPTTAAVRAIGQLGRSATDPSRGSAVFVAADTATTGGRSVDGVLNGLSKGKNSGVWTVPDQSTLQSTFDDLAQGGTRTTWKNYNGPAYELPDGTQIGLRGSSTSGGPTIDIRVPGQDPLKIHIG